MLRKIIVAAAVFVTTATAFAQKPSSAQNNPEDERGFVSFAELGSSFSGSEHVVKLDTSAGYNLSSHLGVDFGVPFYFAGGSSTSSTGTKVSSSASGMGAPYIAARAMYKDDSFRYASRFAIYLPAGDSTKGLSTGRTNIDWTNHFEDSYERVTPFGEIGVANTVMNTGRYNRPYVSFGDNFHLEGGADVDVTDKVSVGGSAFDIFPWGTQAIYSRVVPKGASGLVGNGSSSKNRSFEKNAYTVGDSDLGKDKGLSAWVDYMPAPYITAEAGFTRSLQYDLNSISITMRINIGYLTKNRARQ